MQQPQPETLMPRDGSILKAKVGGVFFLLMGIATGYFFILRPLAEAKATGHLQYYVKGILLPPLCFYVGVMVLCFDLRDGQARVMGADGKPKLTRKGWLVVAGMIVVMGGTLAAWSWYLHSIGFTSGLLD